MKKYFYLFVSAVLVFGITACGNSGEDLDETIPVILGFVDKTLEYDEDFDILDGISAYDEIDGDLTMYVRCTVKDEDGDIVSLNTTIPGDYTVTCSVFDDSGNMAEEERTFTVLELEDDTPPVFVQLEDVEVEYGGSFNINTGVSVTDDIDITVQNSVEIVIEFNEVEVASIDFMVAGDYVVTYTATDQKGNTSSMERTITVLPQRMVPYFLGTEDVVIEVGTVFYADDGVTANDTIQGDITIDMLFNIRSDGVQNLLFVDTSVPKVYSIVYTISNDAGMTATVERTVEVVDTQAPVITASDLQMSNDDYYSLDGQFSAEDNVDGDVEVTYEIFKDSEVVVLEDYIYGDLTVVITAVDSSGNEESKSISLTIVDKHYPVITILESYYRHLPGEPFELAEYFHVEDLSDSIFDFQYEFTNVDTLEVHQNVPGYYGEWEATIVVTDVYGNTDTEMITVYMIGDTVEMYYPTAGQDEAYALLWNFYNESMFLSDSTPEELCHDYVEDVYLPILFEYDTCVTYVTAVQATFTDFTLNFYGEFEHEGIDYYTFGVNYVSLDGTRDYTHPIRVYFKQLEGDLYYQFDFYEFPFQLGDGVFSIDSNIFNVEYYVDTYFTSLYGDTITPNEFCTTYGIYDMNDTECEAAVVEYRRYLSGHNTPIFSDIIVDLGTGMDYLAQEVEIILFKGGTFFENTFILVELYVDGESEFQIMSDPVGENFNNTPYVQENISVTDGTATALIENLYDDLFDSSVTPADFCNQYYLNNFYFNTNLADCEAYVLDIRTHTITYSINFIQETLYIQEETFTFFIASIDFVVDGNNYSKNVELVFTGEKGIIGYSFFDLHLVNLGGYFENYTYANIPDKQFSAMLHNFYSDITDPSISNLEFCTMYFPDDYGVAESFEYCGLFRQSVINLESYEVVSYEYIAGNGVDTLPRYTVDVTCLISGAFTVDFYVITLPNGETRLVFQVPQAFGQ